MFNFTMFSNVFDFGLYFNDIFIVFILLIMINFHKLMSGDFTV